MRRMSCSKERYLSMAKLDLKYLTIEDLEKFLVNLKSQIDFLERNAILEGGFDELSTWQQQTLKEAREEAAEIEAEILERVVLGYKPPGGVSN